nr:hypothetical protein REQ54_04129 [Rhizobium sp. Q54]
MDPPITGNVIAGTWDDVTTRVWKRPKQTLTVTPLVHYMRTRTLTVILL